MFTQKLSFREISHSAMLELDEKKFIVLEQVSVAKNKQNIVGGMDHQVKTSAKPVASDPTGAL